VKINKYIQYIYGILLCILIGISAEYLSESIKIGSISLSIIFGIIIGNIINLNSKFDLGITFSEKHILSLAIIFLGVKLDYLILSELGVRVIIFIILGIAITISTSLLLGKLFNLNKKFSLLLGIGNAICGSSAIAATQKIVGVKKEEIGLSITIVNLLGTLGFFILPILGIHILELSDLKIGVLIGNTLQSVGQVVASGFSVNDSVGQTATIVKMVRILMLTPFIFVLVFAIIQKRNKKQNQFKLSGIPIFIFGFLLFSLIPTFNLLSKEYISVIANLSHYFLLISMAGIGSKIKFNDIFIYGKTAFIVGSITFLIQILISSIGIIAFL
jgi:uncharacterized integral membrane protein (TIGR00698 family)